jgi:hypothetical protein
MVDYVQRLKIVDSSTFLKRSEFRAANQNPKVAAIIGIFAVLLSALGLFNPRGKPFVFHFQVPF